MKKKKPRGRVLEGCVYEWGSEVEAARERWADKRSEAQSCFGGGGSRGSTGLKVLFRKVKR